MKLLNIITKHARLPLLYIGSFFACFLYLLLTASPQLEIMATASGPDGGIELLQNGESLQLLSRSIQDNSSFEIAVVARPGENEPIELKLRALRTLSGGFVDPKQVKTVGTWSIDDSNRYDVHFMTQDPDARLLLNGYLSGLVIPVSRNSKAPAIEIRWNGSTSRHDLYREKELWDKIFVSGKRSSFFTTLPLKTSQTLQLRPVDRGMEVEQVSVTLGDKVIYQATPTVSELDGSFRIDLPRKLVYVAVQIIVTNSIFLLSVCFLFCLIHLVVGLPLLLLSPLTFPRTQALLLGIVAGFFIVNLLTTSLIFAVPIKTAIKLTIGVILALYALLLLTWRQSVNRVQAMWFNPDPRGKDILIMLPFAAAGVLFFFSPAVFEPGWFLGRGVTDSFYYINQAQNLISNPSEQPVLFFSLDTIRYADLATLATSGILALTDTKHSYLYSSIFLWFLLPFVSHGLVRRFCKDKPMSVLIALTLAFSCNLYSLFTFSFLAHYYFGIALIFSLYVSTFFIERISSERFTPESFYLSILAALSFAYCLAIYPYHFFLPVTTVFALLLLYARDRARTDFKTLALTVIVLAGCTILLANVNLVSPISSLGYIKHYNETLNIMAQRVFPFYHSPELASVVFGFSGLGQLQATIGAILSELHLAEDILPNILPGLYPLVGQVLLVLASVLTICGIIIGFVRKGKSLALWSTTTIFYLVVFGILYSRDQIYGYVKLLLSMGPLLSLTMLVGAHELLGMIFSKKISRFIMACFFLLVLWLNLANGFMENSLAMLNRGSQILASQYTGLPVTTAAVKQLEEVVAAQPGKERRSVLVIGESTEYKSSDLDRILNNSILHVFRDYRVMYAHDLESHYYVGFDFGYTENYPVKSADYLLIFRGFEHSLINYPVDKTLLETDLFSLYNLGDTQKRD